MRDGLALRAVKRIVLWQFLADLSIHRAVSRLRGERPWKLAGQCRRSAHCCEAPALEAGLLAWSLPVVRRLFLAWQRRVNGFDLTHVDTVARLRGERPWTLAGQCRRAAQCCEAPVIAAGLLSWSLPIVRRLFLAWQRRVNGFDLTHVDTEARLFVFRCRHFDWTSRSCDSYDSRPGICRDYPRHLLWQANPQLHRRCGYRALPPNAAGLRSAIDALDVSPEQREKLRRGLRLDG